MVFLPELAGWVCEIHYIYFRQLPWFHDGCGLFMEQQLSACLHSIHQLLINLEDVTMTSSSDEVLQYCRISSFYPPDPADPADPWLTRETQLEWQEHYASRFQTEVLIGPLSCPLANLNWTTMHLLLGSLPPEVDKEISSFKLRPTQRDEYMVDPTDGHCYREQTAQKERLSIGVAIKVTNNRYQPYFFFDLLAVLHNSVFHSSWKRGFKSEVTQNVTTYGVHPSLAGSSIP